MHQVNISRRVFHFFKIFFPSRFLGKFVFFKWIFVHNFSRKRLKIWHWNSWTWKSITCRCAERPSFFVVPTSGRKRKWIQKVYFFNFFVFQYFSFRFTGFIERPQRYLYMFSFFSCVRLLQRYDRTKLCLTVGGSNPARGVPQIFSLFLSFFSCKLLFTLL